MAYFTPTFIDFWGELALSTEKLWFDANRSRGVREFDDIDELPPGKFIPRINSNIRFSNDKTSYNTHV